MTLVMVVDDDQDLAEMLGIELSQVSIKATTNEGLGFIGRGEGIAAQATANFEKI